MDKNCQPFFTVAPLYEELSAVSFQQKPGQTKTRTIAESFFRYAKPHNPPAPL
jgi:hypothetical protein